MIYDYYNVNLNKIVRYNLFYLFGTLLPENEINKWILDNNYTIPFNEDVKIEFLLRWYGS